jgi:hypothetical protein
MSEPDLKAMNYRVRYYHAHKHEPEFMERIRKSRRGWYYNNIESERQNALERYYKRKALKEAQEQGE